MSNIEDTNKIDALGIDKECDYVILKIFDHLNWEDEETHLITLQEKINTYLSAIESGEIYEIYPKAKNKIFLLSINFLETLTDNAHKFLFTVANILNDAGYKFEYQVEKPYKLRCIPLID